MRGIWVLALCLAACGDDSITTDGGSDATLDASSDVGDAGPLTCESADPGCVGACEVVYECLVLSSQRDLVIGPLRAYGFTAPDWDDCSRCTARCEADESTSGDDARACFEAQFAASACGISPDPTQAANAIDTCCAGRDDSPFCVESCLGIIAGGDLLNELIPNCADIVSNELQEPTCVGTCPDVTEAFVIEVSTDATWQARSFDVHSDGSILIHAMTEGTIDFGSSVALAATSPTQFVAVFESDGSPRWARALSGGHAGVFTTFGQLAKFDDSGAVVAIGELYESVDLGSGELASNGGADLLVAKWSSDGTLVYARSFGGAGTDVSHAIEPDGDEVVFVAEHTETVDLGVGAHPSAGGTDILVARLDAAGTTLWSRTYGGPEAEIPWGLVMHSAGEYTISGGASSGTDFGEGPISAQGDQDGFVVRFAADGTLLWAHLFGGPTWDIAYQLAPHADAVIVADYVSSGMVDIGGVNVEGFNQPLLRVEADGSIPWVNDNRAISGESGFVVLGVEAGDDGRVYVSANSAEARADLGGGPHDAFTSADMIPAAFDTDGSHLWSMRLGGPYGEDISYFGPSPGGGSILIGEMTDQIDYGPGELTSEGQDLFVVRFAD